MCRLRNIALESVTDKSVTDGEADGQTDGRRTKWSLCVAMLCTLKTLGSLTNTRSCIVQKSSRVKCIFASQGSDLFRSLS